MKQPDRTPGLPGRIGIAPGPAAASSPLASQVPLDLPALMELERQAGPVAIPDVFYDIQGCNRIGLEIYKTLLEAFSDCDRLLAQAKASRCLNLVAVFFHELVRVLCAYYFKRYEIDSAMAQNGRTLSFRLSGQEDTCPYVGYSFALRSELSALQWPRRRSSTRARATETARAFLAAISRLAGTLQGQRAACLLYSPNVAADIADVLAALDQSATGVRWAARPLERAQARVVLPEAQGQMEVLKRHLDSLAHRLARSWPGRLAVPATLVALVRRWIESHLCARRLPPLHADALLAGTLTDLETRIAAARACAQGIPVVSVLHGESHGALDEPVFGYGEQTFVDVMIGYGPAGGELVEVSQFARPLYPGMARYVPAVSEKLKRVYSAMPIPALAELEAPRVMYVPTLLSGNLRYGPFRDMHDVAYFQWQRGLMACCARMFPGKTTWKNHPKSLVSADMAVPGVRRATGRFEDAIDTADVFIFDYVSTAFSLAAATSKPIIYLDIGLRNLTPAAQEAIRERCIYVPADPRQPAEALRLALDQRHKRCANSFTPLFSLPADGRMRHQAIADAIHQVARITE